MPSPAAPPVPRLDGRPGANVGGVLDVTQDVACLPLSIVNVAFIGAPGSGDRQWALVDAGLTFSAGRIARAATARYGPNSRPAAILLTHGHFDHVGALPDLADRWGVPVYAHELELPYLTGVSPYPPPDPAGGGGAMSFLSRLYPRAPKDLGGRVRPLPSDGSVPGAPGWRWVHTPGHTAGQVAFFRDADRALIAGDAFVTQKQESLWGVLTQRVEVRHPPAYFTPDWPAAHRSVELLAGLNPTTVITGHGVPLGGERLKRGLHDLLRNWDRRVPHYGRYVGHPAVTGRRGVLSVPPPVADPNVLPVVAAGLAVAAGVVLARRS